MYRCKHFDIRELVHPDEYRAMGERCWWLLDDRLLATADALRDKFGVMIVNTWYEPKMVERFGYRNQSGLRNWRHYGTIAKYMTSFSQHKYGRAIDAKFVNADVNEVREYMLANRGEFPHVNGIEMNTSWLHFDVRNSEFMKF